MSSQTYKSIQQFSVGTTPVLIGPTGDANNHLRLSFSAYNNGGAPVYLGSDNTVTSSTGYVLSPGVELDDGLSADPWYAVAASGTVDVRVIVYYGGN